MIRQYSLKLPSGKAYPYLLARSKRAKYIRIKITKQGELSIHLPSNVIEQHAHDFIKEKVKWIEKKLLQIDLDQKEKHPEVLDLTLLDEQWHIKYETSETSETQLIVVDTSSLLIKKSKLSDEKAIEELINNWLKKKAKSVFPLMLRQIAEYHGFHYRRLSIRAQKTRWGSCSQDKNISLNCKLLYMPESVVRYVMIHELCHTIEMNHSSRFWTLVAECDPSYKAHRHELKMIEKTITY